MIVLPSIGYPALLPETLAQLDQPYFDGFDAAVQLLCQLVHGRPDDIFARVRRMGASATTV